MNSELGLSNQSKLPTDTVQVRLGFVLKFGHVSACHYHGFVRFVEKWVRDTSIQVCFSFELQQGVKFSRLGDFG